MCAACVTATDPVLASSVVGKGKFAKRVPKHLRDLLSAESGCNDGMAFPFIYLSFYLIHYRPDANKVAYHWFCETILYECIFGATYGVLIGYLGRHMIKWADRRGLIDRESFLVFYFVLALFCAGTGATLGTDDLLVGFAAGVGFSNDGWFTEKTEESHVSNVIDLLLNLAYFVYLGSIIPWEQYNAPQIGLTPWKLVIIAIFVVLFRRIPIMLALKPLIPDIKTWREALFAGHFGPIGVGAIFAAILARAELETDTTTPLGVINPGTDNYLVVEIIWPLTTFLVITSILIHGSSIAVFTLGKRINTLTLTMSYTQATEDGPSWMNRLPRIQSSAKPSMSKSKEDMVSEDSSNEKLPEYAPGTLPPIGVPGNFLRRQKEEESPIEKPRATRRKSRWESGMGPGGPITQSAIAPQRRTEITSPSDSVSDTLDDKDSPSGTGESDEPPDQLEMEDAQEKREQKEERTGSKNIREPELEAYEEGDELIVEDEEGEIIGIHNVKGESDEQKRQHLLDDEKALQKETSGEHAKGKFHPHESRTEGEELETTFSEGAAHPGETSKRFLKKIGDGWDGWNGWRSKDKDKDAVGPSDRKPKQKAPEHKRGPAHAYQYGNTIIVEDEDGEVVKTYDLPSQPKQRGGVRGGVQNGVGHFTAKPMLKRAGTWVGFGGKDEGTAPDESGAEASGQGKKSRKKSIVDPDDDRIRFSVGVGGRKLSKADFIQQIQSMDPKARVQAVDESDVPEDVKQEVRADAEEEVVGDARPLARPRSNSKRAAGPPPMSPVHEGDHSDDGMPMVRRYSTTEDKPKGGDGLTLVDSKNQDIPFHSVSESVQKYGGEETAAQRRRRLALERKDSDDDGTERVPPHTTGSEPVFKTSIFGAGASKPQEPKGETAAERRRRMAALGEGDEGERQDSSDSEDDGGERRPAPGSMPPPEQSTAEVRRAPGIRFADSPAVSQGRVQWGEDVGKRKEKR